MKPSNNETFGIVLETTYPHNDCLNARRVAAVYGRAGLAENLSHLDDGQVRGQFLMDALASAGGVTSSTYIYERNMYAPKVQTVEAVEHPTSTIELSEDDSIDLMAAIEKQKRAGVLKNIRHPLAAIGAISLRYGYKHQRNS